MLLSSLLVLVNLMLATRTDRAVNQEGSLPTNLQAGLLSLDDHLQGMALNVTLSETAIVAAEGLGIPMSQLEPRVQSAMAASLGSEFPGSAPGCPREQRAGAVSYCLEGWGINVTAPPFGEETNAPSIQVLPGANSPIDTARTLNLTATGAAPFVAMVGFFSLMAVGPGGTRAAATYPFSQTTQVPVGLFDSSLQLWSTQLSGSNGEFARIAQYILNTEAQLRALLGYGDGGYAAGTPGPGVAALLTPTDVDIAANLSLEIVTLESFRTVDPSFVASFLASLPPGADASLLVGAIQNGTVDPATLALALLPPAQGWAAQPLDVGGELAQSLASFSDRFAYDLDQTFWGPLAVDPTLQEPITTWWTLWQPTTVSWMGARLQQYLSDYQAWIGSQSSGLPLQASVTNVAAKVFEAPVSCVVGGRTYYQDENYTLFPGGTYSLTPQVPGAGPDPMVSLLYGDPSSGAPFAPDPLDLASSLQVLLGTSLQGNNQSTLRFQLVDRSFLGEYSTSSVPENDTFSQLLNDLAGAMDQVSANPAADGFLPGLASAAGTSSSFASPAPFGPTLPLPGTPGPGAVMGSSWSYAVQGIVDLYSGPYAQGLASMSTWAPSHLSSVFLQNAEQPTGLGTGPTPGAPTSLLDLARLAVRLIYLEDYNLRYGALSGISASPTGAPPSYYWASGPDTPNAPTAAQGPDFAQQLQGVVEGYVNSWMASNTVSSRNPSYFEAPYNCSATNAAYSAATAWYNTSGSVWTYVSQSVVGPAVAGLLGSSGRSALLNAFQAVVQASGNDSWGSSAFQSWVEGALGSPHVLPDAQALLEGPNSWLRQIYAESEQWTSLYDQVRGVEDQPAVQPFTAFSFGGSTALGPGVSSNLLALPPPQITLSVHWSRSQLLAPAAQLHLVDAQSPTATMAAAPFQSSWTVAYTAKIVLGLTEAGTRLPTPQGLAPFSISLTVPLNASFPVTVFTPWPLQTGASGAATDPGLMMARGYLGIVSSVPFRFENSSDGAPCPGTCPGTWNFSQNAFDPAPLLDPVLQDLAEVAAITGSSSVAETSLLAGAPFSLAVEGTVGPTAWDTLLGTTSTLLAGQAGTATTVEALDQGLHEGLTRLRFPVVITLVDGGFLGSSSATLNCKSNTLTFQQAFPVPFGTSPPNAEDGVVGLGGGTLTASTTYLGSTEAPAEFQFFSSWSVDAGGGVSGSETASWQWLGRGSNLSISVPLAATTLRSASASFANLDPPSVGVPVAASMFVAGAPYLPSPMAQALNESVATWVGANPSPTFPTYLQAMRYTAAYYDDGLLNGGTGASLSQWELGTSLLFPGGSRWTQSALEFEPRPGPVPLSLQTLLPWEIEANAEIWSSLNQSAPDLGVLAYLPDGYLTSLEWNVSEGSCSSLPCAGPPPGAAVLDGSSGYTGSYLSVNFAALASAAGAFGEGADSLPLCTFGGTGQGLPWTGDLELY